MLVIEWTAEQGWGTPIIQPYQNLSLDPAASIFHFAIQCFEGMKAYKVKYRIASLIAGQRGSNTAISP
jgi:branched-subunit amino acid aminotransferase/4-amino-4-deoxychorismate lyase